MKFNDQVIAYNKYLCDGKESFEDEFELPTISKIFDIAALSRRMRQKIEPKGEFGLDSSILVDGKRVPIGDIFTSLATGYQISGNMNDILEGISNGLNNTDSKIPISKRFTKTFYSKNGKEHRMDTKITDNGIKTYSTLTSADTFRKIVQNDIVCNEVCYSILDRLPRDTRTA